MILSEMIEVDVNDSSALVYRTSQKSLVTSSLQVLRFVVSPNASKTVQYCVDLTFKFLLFAFVIEQRWP